MEISIAKEQENYEDVYNICEESILSVTGVV